MSPSLVLLKREIENVMYMHDRVLIIKQNTIMPFHLKWMGQENFQLSEIRQMTQNAKYRVWYHVG